MYKSSFTPLFLYTTTGLRHNFHTEHCFFFLSLGITSMEQDLLSFFLQAVGGRDEGLYEI